MAVAAAAAAAVAMEAAGVTAGMTPRMTEVTAAPGTMAEAATVAPRKMNSGARAKGRCLFGGVIFQEK